MNHPGEIAWLAQLAQPTVALVNNAQREHQEFMAVGRGDRARKRRRHCGIGSDDGVAVFPADDPSARASGAQLAGTRRVHRLRAQRPMPS